MTINRDNYEPFFLDYLEGNLEEQNIDQFLDFLEQNPDLKEELLSIEHFRLPAEQVVFSEKARLYKSQSDENRTQSNKLIAYLEGDLETEERKTFEVVLATEPEIQKEYNRFAQTKLIPDTKIHYPNKKKLYRKPVSVIVLNWVVRAAAVVLLVWGISAVIQNGNAPVQPKMNQEIAEISPKKELQPSSPEVKKTVPEPKIQDQKSIDIASSRMKIKMIRTSSIKNNPEKQVANTVLPERDLTALAEISPISVRLTQDNEATSLAFEHAVRIGKIEEQAKVMGVEEFLAQRAERVGKEGLLSVQHLARIGLGVAAEISGDRISYSEKDGKIASVGFESKLLAFTIPLEKK